MSGIAKTFARQLVVLREGAGLSQSRLARLVGTTQSMVSQMESGDRQPSLDMIGRLARALRAHPGRLLVADKDWYRFYDRVPMKVRQKLAKEAHQ